MTITTNLSATGSTVRIDPDVLVLMKWILIASLAVISAVAIGHAVWSLRSAKKELAQSTPGSDAQAQAETAVELAKSRASQTIIMSVIAAIFVAGGIWAVPRIVTAGL